MEEKFIQLFDLLHSKIELITDNFGNPQLAISKNGETWYLTHNVNEANYYISKYGICDVLILNRISGMTKHLGSNEEFNAFIEKLKPSLEKLGYVF